MTTYIGSSPYCYANSLAMTVPGAPAPPVVEALTGSAFGYQQVGPLPLFDPAGWDPDLGFDHQLPFPAVLSAYEALYAEVKRAGREVTGPPRKIYPTWSSDSSSEAVDCQVAVPVHCSCG